MADVAHTCERPNGHQREQSGRCPRPAWPITIASNIPAWTVPFTEPIIPIPSATVGEDKDEAPKYEKDEETGKYVIVNYYKDAVPGDDPDHVGLLPRMWSGPNAENYMKFFGPLDFKMTQSNAELRDAVKQVKEGYAKGEIDTEQYIGFLRRFDDYLKVEPPSIWQNMKYMFQFQFGYMYWRYFMWNFAGKNNDVQGRYNGNGEWLSGIGPIDGIRLGSQSDLPDDIGERPGPQHLLLPSIYTGNYRHPLSGIQKSETVLGAFGVLYVYGPGHPILYESLYLSAAGAGLFPCWFFLCFCPVDRPRGIRTFRRVPETVESRKYWHPSLPPSAFWPYRP